MKSPLRYSKEVAKELRRLSPVFEERAPFVLTRDTERWESIRRTSESHVVATVNGNKITAADVRQARQGHSNKVDSLHEFVSCLGAAAHAGSFHSCEGFVVKINTWDGLGYPCLIIHPNAGTHVPKIWRHDFDLWNFRWDEVKYEGKDWFHRRAVMHDPVARMFNSHSECYAYDRFGHNVDKVVDLLGGYLRFEYFRLIKNAVDLVVNEEC